MSQGSLPDPVSCMVCENAYGHGEKVFKICLNSGPVSLPTDAEVKQASSHGKNGHKI